MLKQFLLILMLLFCRSSYAIQCVGYAQQNGYSDISGDAFSWWDNSQKMGYSRGNVPQVGSVLVWKQWDHGPEKKNPYGHVAIVAKIISDNEILVNHANWYNDELITTGDKVKDISGGRWTKVLVQWGSNYGGTSYDTYGFIYHKTATAPSPTKLLVYRAGTVGWYPTTPFCDQASEWYRLQENADGSWKAIASEDSSICSEVPPACFVQ